MDRRLKLFVFVLMFTMFTSSLVFAQVQPVIEKGSQTREPQTYGADTAYTTMAQLVPTAEPTYINGSTSSGGVWHTYTGNSSYQVTSCTSWGGVGAGTVKLATANPTMTYGTLSGGYWQTESINNSYQVATSTSYSGGVGNSYKNPTLIVNDTTVGTRNWGSGAQCISNWATEDGQVVYGGTSGAGVTENTYYAKATKFGFAIPSTATISSIYVQIKKRAGYADTNYITDYSLKLVKAGVINGTDNADTSTHWVQTPLTWYNYANNTWGNTWSPAQINADNFGLAFSAHLVSVYNVQTAVGDSMKITVYYTTTYYRVSYYYSIFFTNCAKSHIRRLDYLVNGKTSANIGEIWLYDFTGATYVDQSKSLTTSQGNVSATSIDSKYISSTGEVRICIDDGYMTNPNTITSGFTVSVDYIEIKVYSYYVIDFSYAFRFISAPRANVTALNWIVNGLSSIAGTAIYIWSYVASAWVDTSVTLTTSNLFKNGIATPIVTYMDSSGNMKIRLILDTQTSLFTVSVDVIRWDVIYRWFTSPSQVILLSPADETMIEPIISFATLYWNAVSDGGGAGFLTYQVEMSPTIGFTSGNSYYNTTDTHTSALNLASLGYGVNYWRVRAVDKAQDIGLWSDTWRLIVDDPSTYPTKVDLFSPLQSQTVSYQPTWTWNASIDPYCGVKSYQLQVSDDTNYNNLLVNITTVSTWSAYAGFLAIGEYYWRVRAFSNALGGMSNGLTGAWSDNWTFYVGDGLVVVWDSKPPLFYLTDGNEAFAFHLEYLNGTILSTADYTMAITLDGSDDYANWVANGNYWNQTILASSLSLGGHTFYIIATKTGFSDGVNIGDFVVVQHSLRVHWVLQPSQVYQPSSITFSFNVTDEGNVNLFTDATIWALIDGASPVTFNVVGNDYVATISSIGGLSVYGHTLMIGAYKQYYEIANSSTVFTISQHHLSITILDQSPLTYQPNLVLYSFTVTDEVANTFSNATIVADVSGVNAVFSWDGVDRYVWSNSSSSYAPNTYYLHITVSLQYRTGDDDIEVFVVAIRHLYIDDVNVPANVYKPNSVVFSFRIRDEFYNYFGSGVTFNNKIDSTGVTFTYNGTYFVYTLNSGSWSENYHTLFLNVSKSYYASDVDNKIFLVSIYHLSVGSWTGSAKHYYPDNYMANFTVSNELGVLDADALTYSIDGILYPLFPMSVTSYGSGLYGLDIVVHTILGNWWGVGNHTITVTASKLGMATGASSFVFNLGYRSISMIYVGSNPVSYDYANHNYTYRITLDSYITLSGLTWGMKIDGAAVSASYYTGLSYVYVYTTQNLTWGVHGIYVWANHVNASLTEKTTYVTMSNPYGLSVLITHDPPVSVELWNTYTLNFYIVDTHGMTQHGAYAKVFVYNGLGFMVYSKVITDDPAGVYTFSISGLDLGYVLGSYRLEVYIAQSGFERITTDLTSFSLTATIYTVLGWVFTGVAWLLTCTASWGIYRKLRGKGKNYSEAFDNSSRYTLPLVASVVGLLGNGLLSLYLRGFNIFSLGAFTIVGIAIVIAVLVYRWVKIYPLYIVLVLAELILTGGLLLYCYYILGYGVTEMSGAIPAMVLLMPMIVEAYHKQFETRKTWRNEAVYGVGEAVGIRLGEDRSR